MVAITATVELGIIQAPKKGYYCKDPTISYVYTGDTVTLTILILVTFFLPLSVIGGVELTYGHMRKRTIFLRFLRWYRDSVIGMLLALLVVEVAKIIIGEHRPHFINTCAPDTEETCTKGEFVNNYECTRPTTRLLIDSSRSFPSGHSAISVFMGIYLAVSNCFNPL